MPFARFNIFLVVKDPFHWKYLCLVEAEMGLSLSDLQSWTRGSLLGVEGGDARRGRGIHVPTK